MKIQNAELRRMLQRAGQSVSMLDVDDVAFAMHREEQDSLHPSQSDEWKDAHAAYSAFFHSKKPIGLVVRRSSLEQVNAADSVDCLIVHTAAADRRKHLIGWLQLAALVALFLLFAIRGHAQTPQTRNNLLIQPQNNGANLGEPIAAGIFYVNCSSATRVGNIWTCTSGGGGGATIPSTSALIKGDGAGNGAAVTGTGIVRGASGVPTLAELSGDATTSGSNAVSVVRINGIALSGLATGILKNTTTTGVPSIAASADVIGLFTGCSGVLYLGADGACHSASGSGTVTSIATTSPITGGTITGTGTIACATCATTTNGGALSGTAPIAVSVAGVISGGGLGTITGALKGNGSGVITQAACADLSNAAASCATDATNAANITSGTLPNARIVALPNANLANAATTVNGQTCTLGATCTIALSAVNAQTATYQVLAADFSNYKTITVASGTFTITLVASGSQPAAGQYIQIINYGSGVVTVARSGQNINGGTSSLTIPAASATAPAAAFVISDATNYFARMGQVPASNSCTNQAVTAVNGTASATCTTLTSAYVNNSIALTGTDVNTSNQVTVTHLAAALPVNQGGSGTTSTLTGLVRGNASAMTAAELSGNCTTSGSNATTCTDVTPATGGHFPQNFGFSFGDTAGSALTAGSTGYFTLPHSCTIASWNINVDAGTATFDIWKKATGTAIPTVSDKITASAQPAISTGTSFHGTSGSNMSGWSTSVAANDIIGINLKIVSTAKFASITVECN